MIGRKKKQTTTANTPATYNPGKASVNSNNQLVDPKGNPVNSKQFKSRTFDHSGLEDRIKKFAIIVVPLCKLIIMGASAAGTVGNASKVFHFPNIAVEAMVAGFLSIFLCGVIVEGGYGWAWYKKSSGDLVGDQLATCDSIFKTAQFAMYLDIALSVLAIIIAGFGGAIVAGGMPLDLALIWVCTGQPFCGLRVMWLWYVIGGQDPEQVADDKVRTAEAKKRADKVEDSVQELNLVLKKKAQKREVALIVLDTRHEKEKKVVNSKGFKKEIEKIANQLTTAFKNKGTKDNEEIQQLVNAIYSPVPVAKGKAVTTIDMKECPTCSTQFKPKRKNQTYCSNNCKQKAYNNRQAKKKIAT